MNIIQQIFKDHFYDLANTNIKIRKTVFENVERMLHCGDFNYGYTVYGCEHCGTLRAFPFRCKSRFCTSCGNLYSIKRSTNMSFKLVHSTHRHCVFTIPEELRIYFLKDRNLLNCLFHAVRDTILYMFKKLSKSENFVPGFVCVLHTFGRSLQWNPHIHVLLSEGATGNFTPWRIVKHFNFNLLRNSFRLALLNRMEFHIGKSFKKVKASLYKELKDGFYVYAKPNITNSKDVLKYIGRYLGRPVIASSRIDNYDGSSVTFHYNRHEDEKLIVETVSAYDFIKKLIIHIPEKHFKMIRYYGIYAKKHKNSNLLFPLVKKEKRRFLASLNAWRTSLFLSFGCDPIKCRCGHTMTILEICLKGTPLIEKFRKLRSSA